jgi:Rieske Fe-S protein
MQHGAVWVDLHGEQRWDRGTMHSVAQARVATVDWIEALAGALPGRAGFMRVPQGLYATSADAQDGIAQEHDVVTHDAEQVAAYRAADGSLSLCSAKCTHMGCIVHWTPAERSWDCPCHRSRFATDGALLEGPALAPLKPVVVKAKAD